MTLDYDVLNRINRGCYNRADFALASRSMGKIAELADIVVPAMITGF